MKNTLLYAERIAILVGIAAIVHLLASVDWPWAIAIGAAAAALLRALIHRKTPCSDERKGSDMSATTHATTHRATPSLNIAGKYLSLSTYRRDGSSVSTPVWFVEDRGRLLVTTAADSYKARRLRHNPAAMVAPWNARGSPRETPSPSKSSSLPTPITR